MTRSICLLILLALALPALSQQERTVSGVVRDKAGNALPKAVVELEDRVSLSRHYRQQWKVPLRRTELRRGVYLEGSLPKVLVENRDHLKIQRSKTCSKRLDHPDRVSAIGGRSRHP